MTQKITHIVLHYSATYEDQDYGVAEIDKMHRDRGWKMVGYHYVIKRDGTVQVGRPETMVGAHVAGQNTGKLGICCIGGLNRATGPNVGVDNRTDAQKAATIKLVKRLLKKYPGAQVVGHRDLGATLCPGFDVRTWWASVNKNVPAPAAADVVKPAEGAPAKTRMVREDGIHIVEKGDTWWSISQMYGLALGDLLRVNGAQASDELKIGRSVKVLVEAEVIERVPESVKEEVGKKTNLWQYITGGSGLGIGSVGFLAGFDYKAILAIGGVAVILIIILVLMRKQIMSALDDIAKE